MTFGLDAWVPSSDPASGELVGVDRSESLDRGAILALWTSETDGLLVKMRRDLSAMLWGGPYVLPWVCPNATLERRAAYGGRKGRRAAQRLAVRERAREKARRRYEAEDAEIGEAMR
jgi:hypothetical protein